MTAANRQAFLNFVWQPGYDDPADGYHMTPGDAGGGTNGGVIEATWAGAVARGLVSGALAAATRQDLATVLLDEFWGATCDALPAGVDLMLGNGRMMSGGYAKLFQGAVGVDQDGDIGPKTIAAASKMDPTTLIEALTTAHIFYLSKLGAEWTEFHDGWTKRLVNAHVTALNMIQPPKEAPTT
jgi:lysozyme family protein